MEKLKKQQSLSILNLIVVLLTIGINYYSQMYGINGSRVGEMSAKYYNLFTPAGYAFAIWGIIFIGLLFLAGYQIYKTIVRKQTVDFISQAGYWFSIATLATGLWVIVWLYDYTLTSVLVMLVILFSLIKVVVNTNMERGKASITTVLFSWLPIGIFTGWITVATIANIAAYLSKIDWDGGPISLTSWTIIMIIIATLINLAVIYTRKMREFGLVGVWALFAIYVRHQNSYESIAITALIGATVIIIAIIVHTIINRKTNPIYGKHIR